MPPGVYVRKRRPIDMRFWARVSRRGPDECWPWLSVDGQPVSGYGSFWRDGRLVNAHRVAYELAHGPLAPTECALHHCDNPPCQNPAHLFKGTRGDNNRDCTAKGRHGYTGSPGEANPTARLTESDVREIRALLAGGVKQTVVAARYGVNKSTVHLIKQGKHWRHVA